MDLLAPSQTCDEGAVHGHGAMSYVDERPVPSRMTATQIALMFPRGISALYCLHPPEAVKSGLVFPDPRDGCIFLIPGARYTSRVPPQPDWGADASGDGCIASDPLLFGRPTVNSRGSCSPRNVARVLCDEAEDEAIVGSQVEHRGACRDRGLHLLLEDTGVGNPEPLPGSAEILPQEAPSREWSVTARGTPPASIRHCTPPRSAHAYNRTARFHGPPPGSCTPGGSEEPQQQDGASQQVTPLRHRPVVGGTSRATAQGRKSKVILDRVHEHVTLPLVVFEVMDTMEFQRLRSLKQLGTTVYVFPGATHTRFEHSIGVAHLAMTMTKCLAERQPDLSITTEDILCVTLAGLCHDIGHGPFSHLFEDVVNRMRAGSASTRDSQQAQWPTLGAFSPLNSQEANNAKGTWEHEDMSVRLLHRVLKSVDLGRHNLGDDDVRFIELCVRGLSPKASWPTDVGRPATKRFLVDIVANKRNGIDVDKLDYFLRDSLCCYGRSSVDVHIPRLLSACRAMCFEGEYQICFEEKMAMNLGDLFTVRAKLHKYAYRHRIVVVIDQMVSDILIEADPFFLIRSPSGRALRISECVDDDDGFCLLGDWILHGIAASADSRLDKARVIVDRLNRRDLYGVAGIAQLSHYNDCMTADLIKKELVEQIVTQREAVTGSPAAKMLRVEEDLFVKKSEGLAAGLVAESFEERLCNAVVVTLIAITFGSKDCFGLPDNPVRNVAFYNPKSMSVGAFRLEKSQSSPMFSPREFGEKSVMVMVRDNSLLQTVSDAFEKWRSEKWGRFVSAIPTHNCTPSRSQTKD